MALCTNDRPRLSILKGIAIAASAAIFASQVSAETLTLPKRDGPRPDTTGGVPHMQIGISPIARLTEEMLRRVEAVQGINLETTRIGFPGSVGFMLSEDLAVAQPLALVAGREFAHLHPDGSLHASLSPKMAKHATEAGWAIAHPWADQREGWEGFVMIYTPQTEDQLDVIVDLIMASYSYVSGQDMPDS